MKKTTNTYSPGNAMSLPRKEEDERTNESLSFQWMMPIAAQWWIRMVEVVSSCAMGIARTEVEETTFVRIRIRDIDQRIILIVELKDQHVVQFRETDDPRLTFVPGWGSVWKTFSSFRAIDFCDGAWRWLGLLERMSVKRLAGAGWWWWLTNEVFGRVIEGK